MGAEAATAIIVALSGLWQRIQDLHPDVPDVVLLPAPGPRNVLGHFAPLRWQSRAKGSLTMHEVVVVAEHMNRDGAEILETLLHEAAHARNCERGIKDCTASQYHNQQFRDSALELGLTVMQVANYGYAFTQLPDATRDDYTVQIAALDQVLMHRRGDHDLATTTPGTGSEANNDPPDKGDRAPKGRMLKATCACGFIIRAARGTFEATTIGCLTCKKAFTPAS